MINIVGTLGQSLISGFGMMLLASCCCALFYPIFSQLQARLSIANRALTTLCFGLIAPLSTLLGVLVLTHPVISATVIYAHCHGDNCAAHVPAPILSSLTGAGLGALTTLVVVIVFYAMSKRVHNARARQLFLDTLSQPQALPEKAQTSVNQPMYYKLIESEDLVAWCAGLLFPKVYVSSGLIKKLDNVQLRAVLAHEYGHVSRRDNLRKLLLNWSTALWLIKPKKRIQQNFVAQTEHLSDLYSANITGDPQLVDSVYAMFRSSQNPQPPHYAHRNLATRKQMRSNESASPLFTVVVYFLSSLLFIGLTIGLTIMAHVLLENL
ncbi:M48 family metalloprotease [Paraglaciecola sp.]|uniref:M56 family metallopeptidase n=1 Tax=Paraglaciecola sp. TaxID=1920173 RepID=UPI0030F45DAF